MAVVILSGLVTTTFLSLFVLPALYLRYAGGHAPILSPEEELMHRWVGEEPAAATPARAGEGSESGERQPAA
jgi:hypothetical protein